MAKLARKWIDFVCPEQFQIKDSHREKMLPGLTRLDSASPRE